MSPMLLYALWDGSRFQGGGLRIINISNPSNPYEVGFYDSPGDTRSVAVAGSFAYLADAQSGLRIINVSNPYDPREVNFYNTGERAFGVTIVGAYAYVCDKRDGLHILSVSNPYASNLRVGGYDTPGQTRSVAITGTLAYVCNWPQKLDHVLRWIT